MSPPSLLREIEYADSDFINIHNMDLLHNIHEDRNHVTIKVCDFKSGMAHTPESSYMQVMYPFQSSDKLQTSYETMDQKSIRFGLLMEDMESLASHVAMNYLRGMNTEDILVNTISVD